MSSACRLRVTTTYENGIGFNYAGQFTVVLGNAQHIKNVPGRKTDQKDAEWIAQLLQHGLLRPSYGPCEIIRDLRDLTRMRASLSQEASRISSRVGRATDRALFGTLRVNPGADFRNSKRKDRTRNSVGWL